MRPWKTVVRKENLLPRYFAAFLTRVTRRRTWLFPLAPLLHARSPSIYFTGKSVKWKYIWKKKILQINGQRRTATVSVSPWWWPPVPATPRLRRAWSGEGAHEGFLSPGKAHKRHTLFRGRCLWPSPWQWIRGRTKKKVNTELPPKRNISGNNKNKKHDTILRHC